jgi:hypothetical protein
LDTRLYLKELRNNEIEQAIINICSKKEFPKKNKELNLYIKKGYVPGKIH